jgi:radical SAM superfamily enzyme YgiQ (UPF0313 family)
MNPNILFLIPPAIPFNDLESCGQIKFDMYIPTSIPIGVLSISSYLKKYCDVNIRILDFNIVLNSCERKDKSLKEILTKYISEITCDFKPEIIGISALFNSNYSYLNSMSEIAKSTFPDSVIIAGGGLPTNLYKEVLEIAPNIDAVCFGEAEIPILDLVRSDNRKKLLSDDPCWITREKIVLDIKPQTKFVKILDEIPPIDYNLIRFEDYQKISRYHGDNTNVVAISLMTSRGCPFRCCFCASHTVHGKEIRFMSAERVLRDVDELINNYGVNTFLIEDDHFLGDRERALKILNGLKSKNINIEFTSGLTVYAIDEEVADALKEAGVKIVTLAIESGSEYVLKEIIHKPLNLSIVNKVVSILRSRDIPMRAFFMIGLPGESEENRRETAEFIRKTGFNWVAIMIATPIAGSELFKICIENNYLVSTNIEDFHFGKANIKTDEFTPEHIESTRYLMNLDFNFINNYDLLNGNYETALLAFKDVIRRVPNHAFAFYSAAQCYEKLGMQNEQKLYFEKFVNIIDNDKKWRSYAESFKLFIPQNS